MKKDMCKIKRFILKWYYFYTNQLYLGWESGRIFCYWKNGKWKLKSDIVEPTFTKSTIGKTITIN